LRELVGQLLHLFEIKFYARMFFVEMGYCAL
jgi:hypothetical protein